MINLTLILLMAATISTLLLGLGISKVPINCKNKQISYITGMFMVLKTKYKLNQLFVMHFP